MTNITITYRTQYLSAIYVINEIPTTAPNLTYGRNLTHCVQTPSVKESVCSALWIECSPL
jgi:hypothetical protein